MQRLKIVLVLVVIGVAAAFISYQVSVHNKIVVLDPVKIIPDQAIASTADSQDRTVLRISSANVLVLVPGDSDWKAGQDGMELVTGSRIKTDSLGRAQIEYPGGSVTRLDYESEILLETLDVDESNIVVKVLGGRIWSRVSKILGKISYETRSTNVVASVRGTEYEHDVTGGVDNLMVAESSVDVSCINGKKRALLKYSEKMKMDCSDGQPEISEVITSQTIEDATKSGEFTVKIEKVSDSELEDDWRKFNSAREVIEMAREEDERVEEGSSSGKLKISERVKTRNSGEEGERENDSQKERGAEDSEDKVSRWWTRLSQWKSKSDDWVGREKKFGRMKLKCEDDCQKLLLETENGSADKDFKVAIFEEGGREVNLEPIKSEGRIFSSRIDSSEFCSGKKFELVVQYGDGSKVEYGKFDSKDLDCNK